MVVRCWRWGDPGPCPVDEAPHTTCTAPGYSGLTVRLAAPAALASPRVQAILHPPAPEAAPFATSEYRRAEQGARLRGKRGARARH